MFTRALLRKSHYLHIPVHVHVHKHCSEPANRRKISSLQKFCQHFCCLNIVQPRSARAEPRSGDLPEVGTCPCPCCGQGNCPCPAMGSDPTPPATLWDNPGRFWTGVERGVSRMEQSSPVVINSCAIVSYTLESTWLVATGSFSPFTLSTFHQTALSCPKTASGGPAALISGAAPH